MVRGPALSAEAVAAPWPRLPLRGFYRLPPTPCPSPRPKKGEGSADGGGGRLRWGRREPSLIIRHPPQPRSCGGRRPAAPPREPGGAEQHGFRQGGGGALSPSAVPLRFSPTALRTCGRPDATRGAADTPGRRDLGEAAAGRGQRGGSVCCVYVRRERRCGRLLLPAGGGRKGPVCQGSWFRRQRRGELWEGSAGIWGRRATRLAGGAAGTLQKKENGLSCHWGARVFGGSRQEHMRSIHTDTHPKEVENGGSITTKFISVLQPEEDPTCRWNARTWPSTGVKTKWKVQAPWLFRPTTTSGYTDIIGYCKGQDLGLLGNQKFQALGEGRYKQRNNELVLCYTRCAKHFIRGQRKKKKGSVHRQLIIAVT
ncbi:uncharacterized protein [Melanerpes formicivorus]|uniref:uncharacterized protein isoform X2 n=1 Tax=Melanerpes formicivorus TaxID=211600 RepID=UPI0035902D35